MAFIGYVKDTCRIIVDETSNTFETKLSFQKSKIKILGSNNLGVLFDVLKNDEVSIAKSLFERVC